jgi:hypothetical protein
MSQLSVIQHKIKDQPWNNRDAGAETSTSHSAMVMVSVSHYFAFQNTTLPHPALSVVVFYVLHRYFF